MMSRPHEPLGHRTARHRARLVPTVLLGLVGAAAVQAAVKPTFDDVAPVLSEHCVVCHSGPAAAADLRLDTLAGLKAGGSKGKVAVPGDPAASELLRRLRGQSLPRMPLTGPPYLAPERIALIEAWIADGMLGGSQHGTPIQKASRPKPGEPVGYADVAPIFLQRCVKCHSDNGLMGSPPEGLRLATHAQVLAGSERPVVVPGVPGASKLVRHVRGQSLPRMPFDGPPYLSDEEMRLIVDWIAQGAPDEQGAPQPLPVGARVRLDGVLSSHWHLDDATLVVDENTRIRDDPRPGDSVEVRGIVTRDGRILARRIRVR